MMTNQELTDAINNIADNTPNTALELRTILHEITKQLPKPGTLIIRHVPNSYIQSNFDLSGLGINEEVGYAIANGNNGTDNIMGRTLVQREESGDRQIVSFKFGDRDAISVSHAHDFTLGQSNGENSLVTTTPLFSNSSSGQDSQAVTVTTNPNGYSGVDRNYQPSVITLYVMKL